jgi:hypothetical protein
MGGGTHSLSGRTREYGQKRETQIMYLNQQTILGFTGRQAEVTQLKNGTPVTKFSVATKISSQQRRFLHFACACV